MKNFGRSGRPALAVAVSIALGSFAGLALAGELALSGANEAPPVSTAASGKGTITIADDGAVSGSIATTGIEATMAHIHTGGPGRNGPVVVPLAKGADGAWVVPAGAKLTAEQLKSYRAGDLYVNVHSNAHKGGEIRAQLVP